ncbi:VanZ family protein [Tenacibaculum agarivorans]|uniref:VanZ family protein n=1 Tax=Tenacibaculum agarivorans TaxID=1908389 RepID=UPI00094B99C2|nr:VanZ family protein [Tenacibaculum agarivorans]
MLRRIKSLLKDNAIYFAIAITVAIAVLSLAKLSTLPTISFKYKDKVAHAIAYFVLTMVWLFSFIKREQKAIIILGCIIYGILMECLQSILTNYRMFDYYDMIANTFGVLLALLIFSIIEKKLINMLNSL